MQPTCRAATRTMRHIQHSNPMPQSCTELASHQFRAAVLVGSARGTHRRSMSALPSSPAVPRPMWRNGNSVVRTLHSTCRQQIPGDDLRNSDTSSTSSPLGSIEAGEAGTSTTTLEPSPLTPPTSTPTTTGDTILSPPPHLNSAELNVYQKLAAAFAPTVLIVQDISGGCGSMYGIEVESEAFRGLSMLKQQRAVNHCLREEIGGWHGVQLKTRVPARR